MILQLPKIGLALGLACVLTSAAQANNLSITNVALASRDPATKSLVIKFDVSWNNSWHNKINHDAVWLTVRLNGTQDATTHKRLCQILASGLNPAGSSTGTADKLEFYVPSDKRGVFLRRSSNGNVANMATQGAQLTVDYSSCGFLDTDQVYASVFGLEMVFIPQGDFYTGDYNTSTASLNQGSADNNPWHIISENAIPVTNSASGSYYYVSNNNAGEYATGTSFNIAAAFPKGYAPFYVMKYELTEGQWVEFINSLGSSAQRANRDITDNEHKNSDTVMARNTISCAGSPLVCSTQRPWRPVSFLSWMDLAAFLDWDALRPMTELEFEKIARGPLLPVQGEYVWGTGDIAAAVHMSGNEDGTETITDANANANYNNTTFSGGDASQGASYQIGPLRVGIFASNATTRVMAGASYYGVMDISGNLKERVVTIGNAAGGTFDGQHGDGVLSSMTGFEGNADTAHWPGLDAISGRGVTGANGSGFRGGSWSDSGNLLRISDRTEAALTLTEATASFGGRGVRTYDGN
ncbi:MAG: SUMF1/EgtB/PvdO family nonheme iron enzyme [Candidatus Omnitrophica bacterium]|nr:SUMF1/EgtB/PvdO family nonheme iron enzyme [Candidatus Omnitrophota bacterium]